MPTPETAELGEVAEPAGLADRYAPATTRHTDRVFDGHIWNVERQTFDLEGVGELTREVVVHPGAVAIVALDEQQRVLVIQQYRHPIGTYEWEIPAGLLDVAGEDPLECAKRELFEEADLRARSWEKLLAFHSSPGGLSELLHVFIARDLVPVTGAERHERTDEEAGMPTRWVPLEDLLDAVLDGRLRNGTLALSALATSRVIARDARADQSR